MSLKNKNSWYFFIISILLTTQVYSSYSLEDMIDSTNILQRVSREDYEGIYPIKIKSNLIVGGIEFGRNRAIIVFPGSKNIQQLVAHLDNLNSPLSLKIGGCCQNNYGKDFDLIKVATYEILIKHIYEDRYPDIDKYSFFLLDIAMVAA
jgi:hypothetical protein